MQKDLFQTVTYSQQDTLASPSVYQEKEKEKKTKDTFGRTLEQYSKRNDRLVAFLRTFMGTLGWDSMPSSKTLTTLTTHHNVLLYQLRTQERHIEETESGLWPTPTAHLSKEGGYPAEYTRNTPTLTAQLIKADGKKGTVGRANPEWIEWLMGYPLGWTSTEETTP